MPHSYHNTARYLRLLRKHFRIGRRRSGRLRIAPRTCAGLSYLLDLDPPAQLIGLFHAVSEAYLLGLIEDWTEVQNIEFMRRVLKTWLDQDAPPNWPHRWPEAEDWSMVAGYGVRG